MFALLESKSKLPIISLCYCFLLLFYSIPVPTAIPDLVLFYVSSIENEDGVILLFKAFEEVDLRLFEFCD